MKKIKNYIIHILGGYTADDVVKYRIDERKRAYGHALRRCNEVGNINLSNESPYDYVRNGIEYLYNLECELYNNFINSYET